MNSAYRLDNRRQETDVMTFVTKMIDRLGLPLRNVRPTPPPEPTQLGGERRSAIKGEPATAAREHDV